MTDQIHVDWVFNEWLLNRQRRVAVVEWRSLDPTTDRESLAMTWLSSLSRDGTYDMVTAPHLDADCPFKDSDVVEMVVGETLPKE